MLSESPQYCHTSDSETPSDAGENMLDEHHKRNGTPRLPKPQAAVHNVNSKLDNTSATGDDSDSDENKNNNDAHPSREM